VGRPATIGQQLAAEFPFIDYLGGLSDAEVAEEARTWAGFVNPIFAYPRGCSTKLSVPLEWQIPIFTSRAGARGYQWDETLAPLSDTPEALAKDLENANNPAAISLSQQNITLLAKASPTMHSVSTILNQALVASNT
jgi:hypothetical protein